MLQDKRKKSRLTIKQLIDDAEWVMMDAQGIEQAANAAIHFERQNTSNVKAAVSELLDVERQRTAEIIRKEQE